MSTDSYTTEETDYVVIVLKKSPDRMDGFLADQVYAAAFEDALDEASA